MNKTLDEFWWTNITGPQTFVNLVVDALIEGKVPVLHMPDDLPWRQAMRSAVIEKIQKQTGIDPLIHTIDASDEVPEDMHPGDFILGQADENTATGYRKRSGSIQNYLSETKAFHKEIFWIKGIAQSDLQRWLQFCQGFSVLSLQTFLFVLEDKSPEQPSVRSPLQVIEFSDRVNRNDVQIFSAFLIAQEKKEISKPWADYISCACANLCDYDAELAALLIQKGNWKVEEPLEMLCKALDEGFNMRGTAEKSNHIFAYLRKNERSEISQRLWVAQLQTLFPVIEMQRIAVIEEFKIPLQNALDKGIFQFNKLVTVPQDLEYSALCYGLKSGGIWIDKLTNLRNDLYYLRDCRNKLAHHQCCTPEQVRFILEKAEVFQKTTTLKNKQN